MMEGAYGTPREAEDRGDWRKVTRHCRRRGGWKAKAQQKGGRKKKAGDGDGANEVQWKNPDAGAGVDEARWQRAGDGERSNKATTTLQAADGAEHRGDGGVVGGRQREMTESLCSAAAPAAMVAAAAQPEREDHPETPGGGGEGSSPTAFLGLTNSTYMARLKATPQGVAFLTEEEFLRRRSDDMTNGTAGGGGRKTPH